MRYKLGKNCEIHSSVEIQDGATIGNNVKIGAFSIIGSKVKIGDDCILKPNVIVEGDTEIGKNNKIFSFAVIGQEPQDLKYQGEESKIIIGDDNNIREHCTIHPGTGGDNLVTIIGNKNLFMVNTHIAHDCIIGNSCVFANNATLAGHVVVGNNVVFGGLSAAHQKVKIGNGAMLGGISGLGEDLIPYGIAYAKKGRKSSMQGLNLIGLKRSGFDKKDIQEAIHFYREVFESENSNSIFERSEEKKIKYAGNKIVEDIATFLSSNTNRAFCTVE